MAALDRCDRCRTRQTGHNCIGGARRRRPGRVAVGCSYDENILSSARCRHSQRFATVERYRDRPPCRPADARHVLWNLRLCVAQQCYASRSPQLRRSIPPGRWSVRDASTLGRNQSGRWSRCRRLADPHRTTWPISEYQGNRLEARDVPARVAPQARGGGYVV